VKETRVQKNETRHAPIRAAHKNRLQIGQRDKDSHRKLQLAILREENQHKGKEKGANRQKKGEGDDLKRPQGVGSLINKREREVGGDRTKSNPKKKSNLQTDGQMRLGYGAPYNFWGREKDTPGEVKVVWEGQDRY